MAIELGEAEEYRALVDQRLAYLVPVREPLVLVSQIQRSGGTLLSQLFDGHPEVHAHPHELKIGYPREANWPSIDVADPAGTFERLFEKKALTHFVGGYQKRGAKLEDTITRHVNRRTSRRAGEFLESILVCRVDAA